jgi:hypothetical protein
MAGADPGFQVRGAHLKKIAPSGGRRENCWGISYFFPILGYGYQKESRGI